MKYLIDAVGLAGYVAIVYGVYQINENAGIIIGGLMALVFAIMAARKG